MNMMAKQLGLLNTKYANPHGLNCIYNKSSSEDQARLVSIAVANCKMFCQIVDTVSYECEIQMAGGKSRQQKWQNTNYLLGKVGCIGTKTGITPWAGACMATQFKINGINLIIVLLKASYIDYRFTESIKLLKHVLQKKEEWDFMKKNQNCLIKQYRNQQLYDQIDQELILLNEKIKNGQSNNQIQQEYSEKIIMVNQNQKQIDQDKTQQQKLNQDDSQEQKEYDSNDTSFDENDDCDYEEFDEEEETQNQDIIQNE
ncbi:Beta-lactamase/transpeptidase-like protein [Pseudocohnilembus persalinus]|uniref:Beta-lactamase/transpeptidase-like protein n=1 Tax=Pseudocohnilembus persalinus TaxID=266149 RepID=A0A0V0QXQ3_PSEPJ|nr:Beta-lactamase/transpeptidase-like protein [Pseudocohnilembus persalinus]|eukprot:KRX07063.1 Beta-lactamase/transpeptidase-like protein [Pseudocohnilembus persalinus]